MITAPSVKDYERMTQRARLAAAKLVRQQLRDIETRRRATAGPGARKATEYDPAETVEVAKFLLVNYRRTYRDTPAQIAERHAQVIVAVGPRNGMKVRAA